jgi:MSHA biogenesis protein MshE|tara:strand:+ start:8050 stop:9822 length:1773 start_codon:yes stop_codon:yes gene_type:complete
MSELNKKIRIGDLLIQNNIITEEQLMTALAEQKKTGRKLGRALIELGFVEEDKLLNLLSQQLKVPFVQLRHYQFDPELIKKLPETQARRFRAIVLDEQQGELLVGMADPMDLMAYDEIARVVNQAINVAVIRESELLNTLDMVYRRTDEISSLAVELDSELEDDAFDLAALTATGDDSDAPVVKLLQSIFEDAIQARASDIHIEPDESVMRIRQRIDGVLQEQVMKETRINAALVLRLKLMSGLNISEKRIPQDGRFNIRVKARSVDVRLSTMPTQYGESVVMRLLDQTDGILSLEKIGMPAKILSRFRVAISRPHGLVLVTGPTGSGKTTTLYSALSELNKPEVKIITAEDPVEYRLPRITQVQVNPKVGLTFSSVLRACLRQDPDIVLVGEMRDQETAEIGLRAAMTGHMVMSTLHTNDAIGSAMRLIDMGAEPYLVASSLQGVIAQRLIRRICQNCSKEYQPTTQESIWLSSMLQKNKHSTAEDISSFKFKYGSGCYQCSNTGYKGRVGIYEWLEMDDACLSALRRADSDAFSEAAHNNQYYEPLEICALHSAREGITSLDEVFRVSATLGEAEDDFGDELDLELDN